MNGSMRSDANLFMAFVTSGYGGSILDFEIDEIRGITSTGFSKDLG